MKVTQAGKRRARSKPARLRARRNTLRALFELCPAWHELKKMVERFIAETSATAGPTAKAAQEQIEK